jgi:hypothetical protein
MSIHDAPLEHYPGVIATLIRQRTLKIVKQQLQAKGVRIWDVTHRDLVLLAEAYFASHRNECVRVAIDTIRIADGLRQLAEAGSSTTCQGRREGQRRDASAAPNHLLERIGVARLVKGGPAASNWRKLAAGPNHDKAKSWLRAYYPPLAA